MAQPRDPATGRFVSKGGSSGGGGTNLGTAYGEIVISTDSISSSVRRAQEEFDRGIAGIGQRISTLGDTIAGIGSSLTVLTAPITAFGVQGVRAAMSFEDALVEIQARAGLTGEELEAVKQKALQLGQDTAFSAGQAADAFLQLLTSGQSVEEAMTTIDAVMTGAAAAGADLGYTADTLTDIMAQFNNQGATAGDVLQALTKASGSSSATFTDLAAGFQNVGGLASQMGLSVADTAAILATFSENGIKGAEAGTALKSMLTHMASPVKSVQDTWDRLGVSMFDAMGNARPLNDVIRDLNVAMSGMSDEDRVQSIQKLAGSYGQLGLQALLASDGFSPMLDSMRGAADATTIAEARMSTFRGSIEFVKGSIETLQIKVLTPFMNNTLRPLVNRIGEVINKVSEWVDANPELAQTITKVLAGLAAAGPVLLVVGKALGSIGGLISNVSKLFTLLGAGPVGIVVAALGGLALVLDQLGIIDLGGILSSLGAIVGDVIGQLGSENIFDALSNSIADLGGGLFEALGFSPEQADAIAGGIADFIQQVETGFGDVVNFIQTTVIPGLQTLADWFLNTALPAVVGFVQETVIPAIQDLFNFIGGVWDAVSPSLLSFGNWFLNDILPLVVSFIQDTVIPIVQDLFNFISNAWNDISPGLTELGNWFLNEALPEIVNFLQTTVHDAIQTFISLVEGIWATVEPALTTLWNWFVTEGLPAIQEAVQLFIDNILNPFIGLLQGIWEVIQPGLSSFLAWFQENGLPFINQALQWFLDNVLNPVIDVIMNIYRTVEPALGDLMKWFTETGLPLIVDFINNVVGPAIDGLISLLSGIWTTVQPFLNDLKNGIETVFNWIKTNVIDPIIQRINEFVQTVNNIASAVGLGGPQGSKGNGDLNLPKSGVGALGVRDSGGPGVAGKPYLIGTGAQPELFVPKTAGQFYPNAGAMGGVNISSLSIYANSKAEGAAAAEGFNERLQSLWASRGN